jgi:hypothetical protein
VPWRGPAEPGEYPTLGYLVGGWIQEHLIIPDGLRKGEPYLLTEEMWRFVLEFYRLKPHAVEADATEAFRYHGAQLMRPQKWGKDPFAAAIHCVEALGPAVFAGWNEQGEPVGRPWPTPWQQCAATAEEQTANTFAPLVTMLRDGPLADTPGLDVGETRIKLPRGDGWLEPVTASAKARLGARLTFATFTESHLLTESDGGITLARAMKRNLAGMGGRWLEVTNAYDPSEGSVAQLTAEAVIKGLKRGRPATVLVDYRPPRITADLDNDEELAAELAYVYGDSVVGRHGPTYVHGEPASWRGWVQLGRIAEEARDEATGEAEARRYFLNECRVGSRDLTDAAVWDARAVDDVLAAGDAIALGFDGSRSRDATSLQACRLRDGRHFAIGTWVPERGEDALSASFRARIDQVVRNVFDAYEVWFMFADPYLWQEHLSVWAGEWGELPNGVRRCRIIEFPTTAERQMDEAIERFLTDLAAGDLTHDGDATLARHVKACALANGKRRPPREDGSRGVLDYYRRMVKKRQGVLIDAAVAAVLARAARGRAIEEGALIPDGPVPLEGSLMT